MRLSPEDQAAINQSQGRIIGGGSTGGFSGGILRTGGTSGGGSLLGGTTISVPPPVTVPKGDPATISTLSLTKKAYLYELPDTPEAPPANQVVIYCKDNGAGKTEVFALFNTGAAQSIAVQP